MIRPDPERPGVYIVDVSDVLVESLSEDWSRPVQHKIEDGMLVMRALEEVSDGVYRVTITASREEAGT